MHTQNNELVVSFKDPDSGKESLKPCFTMTIPEDYFTEDHDVYWFMSANAGLKLPNEHIIHQIRFKDTKHLHDSEEVDSEEDKRAFVGKAVDMIRKGAIQKSDEFTTDAYNNQLIRHNKMYSSLVSEFIAN